VDRPPDRLRGIRHRDRQAAETTRQAALGLGAEAGHAEIQAWAHEIRVWIALTSGNYHGVISAAQAGRDSAPHHGVAVQLAAQEAKAWARIGDRRQTEAGHARARRHYDRPALTVNHGAADPS